MLSCDRRLIPSSSWHAIIVRHPDSETRIDPSVDCANPRHSFPPASVHLETGGAGIARAAGARGHRLPMTAPVVF